MLDIKKAKDEKLKAEVAYYLLATLLPVLFVMGALYSAVDRLDQTIVTTKQEVIGLTRITAIQDAVITMQTIRGLSLVYLRGHNDQIEQERDKWQVRLVDTLQIIDDQIKKNVTPVADPFAVLQSRIETLFLNKPPSVSDQSLFDQHTAVIADVNLSMCTIARDTSLLIDQALSTHLIIELLVYDLPEIVESIAKMRGMGSGIIESRKFEVSKKMILANLLGGIENSLKQIVRRWQILLATDPTIQPLFANFEKDVLDNVKQFMLYSSNLSNIPVATNSASATEYFALATNTINKTMIFYNSFNTEVQTRLTARMGETRQQKMQMLGLSALGLLVMLLFIVSFFFQNKRVMDNLKRALAEVRKNREKLSYEREIIESTLHRINSHKPFDERNIEVVFKPLEKISGDIFFSTSRPDGVRHIFLGDFTGHGLTSALGAPMVSEIFHRMTHSGAAPLEILQELNTQLYYKLPANLYLVAGFLEFDAPRKQLTFWNCGLPEFLHYRNNALSARYPSNHLPIGILSTPRFEISANNLLLQNTDCFFMYSDGVLEVTNDHEAMFGSQAFETLLARTLLQRLPMNQIFLALTNYHGTEQLDDDTTIIKLTMEDT